MNNFSNKEIVFVSAKRTPFGSFCGSLKLFTATELGVLVAKAALKQSNVPLNKVDHVIFGNVLQTSRDAIYLARHIALKSNLSENTPALTVNRLCGSGLESIICGARQLALGESECVLVGGSESMSQSPHVIRGARWGLPLAKGSLEDSLWSSLTDTHTNSSMGITAENLAEKYNISQFDVDDFSCESQKKFQIAQSNGFFSDEIINVTLKGKNNVLFKSDEHPRSGTIIEDFKKLPRVFKQNGVIHAGAASGICDGSSALIMCTMDFAKKYRLIPICRFINYGITGCNPDIMGIGPVTSTKVALKKSKLDIKNIDLFEINEAFAPQVLAVQMELGIEDCKLNVDGGAISIGHPLGASGSRIISHLIYALKYRNKQIGLGGACIGGGQGVSVIVENI